MASPGHGRPKTVPEDYIDLAQHLADAAAVVTRQYFRHEHSWATFRVVRDGLGHAWELHDNGALCAGLRSLWKRKRTPAL